ncbi:MAG: hypothetical protein LBB45_01725 [Methanobrevibacter sp.]|jgi:hypothetical protein|nr:hypothetical protein [Candidatus Methanovirga basalitermitum]
MASLGHSSSKQKGKNKTMTKKIEDNSFSEYDTTPLYKEFTRKKRKKAIELAHEGFPDVVLDRYLGLRPNTVKDWKNNGRKAQSKGLHGSELARFSCEYDKAKAENILRVHRCLNKMTEGDKPYYPAVNKILTTLSGVDDYVDKKVVESKQGVSDSTREYLEEFKNIFTSGSLMTFE